MLPHRFRETGDFHGRTTEAASSTRSRNKKSAESRSNTNVRVPAGYVKIRQVHEGLATLNLLRKGSHFYLTSPYSERLSGPFRSEDDALEHLYNMYG